MPFASPVNSGASADEPEDGRWAKVLEGLVRILTGYAPMRFTPFYYLQKHGETPDNTPRRWRTILGLEEIQYLPEDVDDPDPAVSLGRSAHEVWHVLFSRPELIFDEPELIKSMAFQALWWAIEDPRVNILGVKRHPGARKWLDAAYAKDYEIKDLAAERNQWAEMPLHLQFNYALIYQWWSGRPDPRATDARVLEALREADEAVQRAYWASDARKSFRIIRDEVWPIYKRLVDQAYEDQQKKRGQQGEDQQEGEGDGEGEGESGDGQRQSQGKPGESKGGKPQVSQSVKDKMEKAERDFRDKHASKMVDKPEKMSEKDKVQMKKDLEAMRKKMGQPQDGEGKDKQKGEAQGSAQGEGEGAQAQNSPEHQQAQRERLTKPDERDEDLSEHDRVTYKEFYDRVKHLIPVMRQQFLQELKRKIRRRDIRRRDSGDLDGEALSRIPMGKRDVFKESLIANKTLYRVSLLIDTSGSMNGEKRERAIEGAIMMMESLDKLPGVVYEIVVFDSKPRVVKPYGERLTPEVKTAVVKAIAKGNGSTESHVAVQEAVERIRMGRGEKLMIMVNDGDPDNNFDRDRYRAMVRAAKDVDIHGVGLGPDAQLVLDLFPPGRGWWLKDAADFAKNLRSIIKKKILGGA